MEQYEKIVLGETKQNKHAHFTKITIEDRKRVRKWLKTCEAKTGAEQQFLDMVRYAVSKVNNNYWIATIEPSVKNGEIYYAEGEKVGVGFKYSQWKHMAKKYAPEYRSRLCTLNELFIWYALRIVNGQWTLEYVTIDSSDGGNYWNAPNSAASLERSGARECGGYKDGQGNTYKIVSDKYNEVVVGGDCNFDGYCDPVASTYRGKVESDLHFNVLDFSTGVVVMLKDPE